MKKNGFFIVIFAGIILAFIKRYSYLPIEVVSNPDSEITFSTEDGMLEQTWQPIVKAISGVSVPYYAENDFSCDVQMKVLNDDYTKVLAQSIIRNVTFKAGDISEITCDFGRIPITQGERLRIQCILLNASDKGVLQVAAGENYGGCTISGEKYNRAVAFKITYVKFSRLFWLVAVCFPLLSFSLFIMVVAEKKWEETVALSLFLEGIILYIFGLFEHLVWGMGAIYFLASVSMLAAVFIYNKKKLEFRDLLSPGLFIYFILFGLILITCKGDWIGIRDELRHWGMAARDMFYYDSFAKHMNTTVDLPRYLPFAALIEYAFEFVNGTFVEDILFVAFQTMLLSVVIILCKPLQKENKKRLVVPAITAMICIPIIFFQNISSSIMVDSLMAVIIAYILVCYYSEEMNWFTRIRIIGALIVLTLLKEVGLVLAGVTVLIIFGDILFTQIKKKKLNIRGFCGPVGCIIIILAVFFSWQLYLYAPIKENRQESRDEVISIGDQDVQRSAKTEQSKETVKAEKEVTSAISASSISVEGLKNIITGKGEWYQYQTTRNFITELLDGDTYSWGSFKISFVDMLAMIAFITASLAYFGYWEKDKARYYVFSGMSLIAGACFCGVLQIFYWFNFPMYDAMGLTSVDRYLAPYIYAVLTVSFFLIYDGWDNSKWKKRMVDFLVYVITFLLIINTPVKGIVFESKNIEGNATKENRFGHWEIAEILRSVASKGERAYFICSNSDGHAEYIFRNAVCPIVTKHENWNIVPNEEVYRQQFELYDEGQVTVNNTAKILSVERWKEELRNCKYVVVFHADELFKQAYGDLFEEKEIPDGSVYQVIDRQGDISLQLMGTTKIQGFH